MSIDPLRPTTGSTQKSWADEDSEEDDSVHVLSSKVETASLADRLGPASAKAKPFVPAGSAPKTQISTPAKPSGSGLDQRVASPTKQASSSGTPAASDESKAEQENLVKTTHEVRVKLADLQADPDSPLYSAKSFEDLPLHADLLKGLYSMRFQKPSKIQERALPLLLADPPKNMIGQSQSGTGKTAAFVLTMLSRVDYTQDAVQALCIAPSRELARQIMDSVTEMGKYTKVTTAMALKDTIEKGQKVTAQIVVGTPGTVMDLVKRNALNTKEIKVLVLDEADNMLDRQGLGSQSLKIRSLAPKTSQIVLFSATFPEEVEAFASKFAPNANEIKLKVEELSVDGIKQLYMDCNSESEKYDVLSSLYGILTIGQSIIFVRKRETADYIARRMTEEGHQVISLHGAKEGTERDQIMDDFREGRKKVLITTNVIARGIDVLQVNMVVNYDMPTDQNGKPDPETYLHRIGRTGRFGRLGISINFVHDNRSFAEMDEIQQFLGRKMTRVPTDDLEELEKVVKSVIRS
ncbi:ATP-dependent RNA helicase dbp5 [Taphrina deformans PYCC 5710]|uniref:ATP-dependent RNA helicase DBP5 n=1 Tax=Taphrina deformans (strain PYCC 5710 / ATCC 11124 / CBS 356.35 / IMI 108563 / JCM 9778 / NBRC 8474) TaxID=1097556 RepID=R4XAV9_TAPDE|nr:ATP-dependent RNA helicase dbp5 [Taphrina deformans PYCC 5710]|eukprot:CCG82999.1 ATP-dependent RNA helicase dbp5 [Taphrina deformans PYCC 5710]